MKLRKLLSLLLAIILCATIALSMFACGDDEVDEETTAEATPPDDGGEDVDGVDDGEDLVDVDDGEDVVE